MAGAFLGSGPFTFDFAPAGLAVTFSAVFALPVVLLDFLASGFAAIFFLDSAAAFFAVTPFVTGGFALVSIFDFGADLLVLAFGLVLVAVFDTGVFATFFAGAFLAGAFLADFEFLAVATWLLISLVQ